MYRTIRFSAMTAAFAASAFLVQAQDRTGMANADLASVQIVAEAVAAEVATPDPAILRKGFANLSEGARIHVQKVMANAGLYDSGIDGLYGPGTEAGAIAIAAWVEEKSGGANRFDLSTPRGVTEFFAFLRDGGAAPYLN